MLLILAASAAFAADDAAKERAAAALILRGNYKAALAQIDGIKSTGSAAADKANLRGLALLLSGDAAGALREFDAALASRRDFPEGAYNRGVALLRLERFKEAADQFDAVWKMPASDWLRGRAAMQAGVAASSAGQLDVAEAWLTHAATTDPSLEPAVFWLGLVQERKGDYDAAAKTYWKLLEAHPEAFVVALRFGVVAGLAGRTEVAVPYLQKVVQNAPSSAEAAEASKYLVLWSD